MRELEKYLRDRIFTTIESQGETYHFFDENMAVALLLLTEDAEVIYQDVGAEVMLDVGTLFTFHVSSELPLPGEAEFEDLMRLYFEHGQAGIDRWACLKMNRKPWSEVSINRMKEAGVWDEALEALPGDCKCIYYGGVLHINDGLCNCRVEEVSQ